MATVEKIKGTDDIVVLSLNERDVTCLLYCLDSELDRDLDDGSIEQDTPEETETYKAFRVGIQQDAKVLRDLIA